MDIVLYLRNNLSLKSDLWKISLCITRRKKNGVVNKHLYTSVVIVGGAKRINITKSNVQVDDEYTSRNIRYGPICQNTLEAFEPPNGM